MWTIKELAELLGVSKTTIQNKIKELKIIKQKQGNRIVISAADAKRIAVLVDPQTQTETLQRIEKSENKTEKITENEQKIAQNEKQIEKNENIERDQLISMLQKALEDKEQTIRAQQNQIDMLIKSNAMLTARLEDKSGEAAAAVDLQPTKQKISFFDRLFRRSSR